MAVSTSLSGISAYDMWCGGGVPAWPGFPAERFAPLNTSIHQFRGAAAAFHMMLGGALQIWDQMSMDGAPPGENILRTHMLVLLSQLSDANRGADTLIIEAQHVKSEAAQLSGGVDRFIINEINERNAAQAEIDSLHIQIAQQERVYHDARSELEGSKGVLNGFITGITFGICNKVKQNMDRASAAITGINTRIASIRQGIDMMNRAQSEINEAKIVVDRLGVVDTDMSNCQNAVNEALILLTEAVRDFENADVAERQRVFSVFVQMGASRMARLRQWEQDFYSLT